VILIASSTAVLEIHHRLLLSVIHETAVKRVHLSMGFLVAPRTKSNQILSSIVTQTAPWLNVMDLKILHAPARLATPAISLQDLAAELAIIFRTKPQAGPLCTDPLQNVTCTSSRSCFRCGFGSPMTSRMRHGNRAFRLPASKLTPARKSAQIISRQ
jgi:hypothetical protein